MDSVETDAQELLLHVSRKLIELWECKNNWTLDSEHKEVLEAHMSNPYVIAQGLDELTFEYSLLYGGGSRSPLYTGAMVLQSVGF